MNKKIALFILIGTVTLTLLVLLIIFLYSKRIHSDPFTPAATTVNTKQQEDEKYAEGREKWIEQMHYAAPGTNWRKIDNELRFKKMQQRAQFLNSKYRSGEYDTLAAGNLIGKWSEVGSYNTSGRMRATEIDFSTNTIYAFSQGGNLWKGDLDGTNWAVINDNFNIQSALFMRKLGNRLIVATDGWQTPAFYFTEDEGITWNQTTGLDTVTSSGYIFDVEMVNDSMHTIYLLAYYWDYINWYGVVSLYRSVNLGNSFTQIKKYDAPTYGYPANFSIWAPRNGNAEIYLAQNDSIFNLDTAGVPQFINILPATYSGNILLSGNKIDGETHLYIAKASWAGSTHFFNSHDGGITITEKGNIAEGAFASTSFNASENNDDYIYFGGTNAYRSYNGGNTWTKINDWTEYYGDTENKLHADIPFIKSFFDSVSNTEYLLISTDGGLYKSTNAGLTFKNITLTGMRNAQYYDTYTYRYAPDVIFAGSQDQGYQRSLVHVDDKYYFDQLISGDYGHLVSNNGGDYVWMDYPGFIMLAVDASGLSNLYFWNFVGTGNLWLPPIMEDPLDENICWWGGGGDDGGAYLYKIKKTGADITYTKMDYNFSPGLNTGAISAIAYSHINTNYWYVLMSDGIFYYSTDAGNTWTQTTGFTGPGSQYFYGSTIIPSTKELGVIYIGGSGYSNPAAYKSTDNGATFFDISTGMPQTLIYDMAITPNDSLLFAATETGPYVYVKNENMWYDIASASAPYQTYWSVEYVDEIKSVRYGTYGRGVWQFKLYEEEAPAFVSEIKNNAMQIFPNPANENINITLNQFLPDANMLIYDVNGNIVMQKQGVALNNNIPYHVNVAALNTGIYFVEIKNAGKTNGNTKEKFIQKFIINK